EPTALDGLSFSAVGYPKLPEQQSRNKEQPLESTATTREQTHGKVNIAETSANERSAEREVETQAEQHRPTASANDGCPTLDDELEALFGKDWNNNLDGKRASKVKMMVQQYEQDRSGVVGPTTTNANDRTNAEAAGLSIVSSHPDISSFGEVETSDFESASVTSGSSVCGGDVRGGGGRHSVRTSSAFSEGSRDVASMDRFELAEPASQQAKQQEEPAGHNTMITININYRCDNNPVRTNKVMCVEKEELSEKKVDILVSSAPQTHLTKSMKSDNQTRLAVERYVQRAADSREDELMDLEESETTEPDGPALEDDVGSGNNKTECLPKELRGSLTSNRSCRTPDDEEYHDCDDLHESTLSFYEQANSQPTTPQEQKKRASRVHDTSGSSAHSKHGDGMDGEQPMIRIVQELAENRREVTSTITMNKAQIRDMQQATRRSVDSATDALKCDGGKQEKRRKSHTTVTTTKKRHDKSNLQRQQRIIDDNFCNEILDSTIHFDRLYGIDRAQRHAEEKENANSSPSPTRRSTRTVECLSDSVVCDMASPGEESFDSGMSVGKLEGKPRYSGKTVGRLMMKRLKKLHGGTQKQLDTSDVSTSSSQASGPKKPPRTFANAPKRSAVGTVPVASCPSRKDVQGSSDSPSDVVIGWKLDSKPKSHQVGWTMPAGASGKNESIPAQVYSMLNYSEDEGRKQLIKTGNSKPAPQQSSKLKTQKYWGDGEPIGPKMNIDMVDGIKTPSRRHSTSTDFERFVRDSNVKSTPHRKSEQGNRSDNRRRIEQFLSEERYQPVSEVQRKLPGPNRRRRTTGGIFEQRRQQQENFLDDARRTNHEPRRRNISKVAAGSVTTAGASTECCPMAAVGSTSGKIEKRRTFRKAALLKRTRTLFEASKKKIWAMKKFETPKKLNAVSSSSTSRSVPDPNINRDSSVKKKHNLHHKHLGYTPDHLRCKSCSSGGRDEGDREDVIAPKNYCPVRQNPAHTEDENKENRFPANERGSDGRQRRAGEEINRKLVRSLNFASARQTQRLDEVDHPSGHEESPRKIGKQLNDLKFLKTLRNLKISPKRMFRFSSQSSTTAIDAENGHSQDDESHIKGEFQSFDDLNLDDVANMGDFLSNIRRKIDGAEQMPDHPATKRSPVRQSSASRAYVPVDVHGEQDDPIYQEISPKGNKMILNEFISSETNKRYLMVNNNPNILYAMVDSKPSRRRSPGGRLVRARSLTNVQGSSCVVDPTVTSTPISKPQNNTSKSQVKPSNRRVTMSPRIVDYAAEDGQQVTGEQESCLYSTALTDQAVHSGGASSSGRAKGLSNASGSTTGSSTRRSLFSRHTSTGRSAAQQQQSTDDSDISILQEEESGEDTDTTERRTPIVDEPLIVRERVEDRLVARRETERFQQKPTGRRSEWFRGGVSREDSFAFEKDIIVEEQIMPNDQQDFMGSVGQGQTVVTFKKAHKSVQVGVDGTGPAPLSCFDADGEIESLRKYDDREIEELVHSLHDNVTLSDIGTIETETTASSSSMGNELDDVGYDTVDAAHPVSRMFCQPASENLTINTVDVSELISHAPEDSLPPANVSRVTSSPSSGKLSTSGAAVMRNLKDKLRSSFRKSKTFIKNERQRIVSYLQEDRSGSRSSSSANSCSSASSPRRRTVQQTQSATPGRKSDRPRQESDPETDDLYQSFTEGSNSIVTASSMTELSSQHMTELMQQIVRQGDARKQLKQALAICRSTREFECSPELIEAERLLLVATQKETAVRNELNKIDYLTHGMTLADGKRVGTVTLSNFQFPLKETAVRDTLFNYFYVVVCTYKHEVKATVAKERHSDGRVYFRDCAIQFQNLDANYEIKVEVFVLQLRKNVKSYSFESRYHLEKDTKRHSCPSPSKKLREAGRMLSFRSSSPKTFDFDNEFSRLKSQGFLTLTSFTLLTANDAEGEGDGELAGDERPFDATYATARTSHTAHASSLLEDGEDACSPSYYSTSGHFHPIVCQQDDDRSVVFIAEDFKYLTLDSMAYTSNMIGTIGMSVRSEVRFVGADVCGFLDVGEKVDEGITWSRRWCKMNGFLLEFWNYPQECQEKQPVLFIDLVKCINERIELADRTICSRPRTVKVEIFSSRAAAAGTSCNSSGIGSFRSTGGRTTSPTSVGGEHSGGTRPGDRGPLRPMSPAGSERDRGHNNVKCYLLAADTQSDLKSWIVELNRVVNETAPPRKDPGCGCECDVRTAYTVSVNFHTRFGPISVTYMADPFGQKVIECGFSNLPQWSMIVSERGSIVKPRTGIIGEVGPFTAYTRSPYAATSNTRPRSGSWMVAACVPSPYDVCSPARGQTTRMFSRSATHTMSRCSSSVSPCGVCSDRNSGGCGMVRIRRPAALNFSSRLLQYPSATKISPVLAIATAVGLQRWLLEAPGSKRWPSVMAG
uniref:PH domain-containing protein n=1 Tax=Anopheles dirus TaxID=7168 RepID=A0A182NJC6_9DIPT